LLRGKLVERLIVPGKTIGRKFFELYGDVAFFNQQTRVALRHNGVIDPESIEEYFHYRGFEGLAKVLDRGEAKWVIDEITDSKLRGRGGGGYPTGKKWAMGAAAADPTRYLICNADEGGPGAFMDRSVLESDPFNVIEGMIIGGFAIGAGDIFGATGGVMEATLRAASELVTGKPADRLEFTEVRAVEGLRETYVAIGQRNIHVGVANGLTNAKVLLNKIVRHEEEFHVIEVMACPGGCIGGGGQPYPRPGVKVLDPELLRKRASALYAIGDRGALRHVPGRAGLGKGPPVAPYPLRGQTSPRHPMSTSTDN